MSKQKLKSIVFPSMAAGYLIGHLAGAQRWVIDLNWPAITAVCLMLMVAERLVMRWHSDLVDGSK